MEISRRKLREQQREAAERTYLTPLIGDGKHIGHLPLQVDTREGWTFRRCCCGFALAMSPAGAVYWLRMSAPIELLAYFTDLLFALSSSCRLHHRDRRSEVCSVDNVNTKKSPTPLVAPPPPIPPLPPPPLKRVYVPKTTRGVRR